MKKMWGVLIALAVITAGCSTGQDQSTTGAAATGSEAQDGGTLIVARMSDANNLDPHYSTQINAMAIFHHKIYEGLVSMDKNSEYQPSLATEWTQVDDVTWEFKLREGVQFHDGTPFNADAVKATFDRIPNTPKAGMFSMIKETKIIDEYTIQLVLEYPYSPIFSLLSSAEGNIISPESIKNDNGQPIKNPVGTGPFTFESWVPGQDTTLVRNEAYWGEQPSIDKLVFRIVPEDATRVAMVEAGEAHVAEQLPVTDLERVTNSASMTLGRFDSFAVEHIGFNTSKPPFDDKRVRQAVAYAIDKESIVSGVYNDVGKVSHSELSPSMIGYSPNVTSYEYDLNKAKELLAEAGYANGLKTSINVSDSKARISVAEVLQSQLKGIGIDLTVNVMEFGAYVEATGKGDSEMFISGWGNATGDADYNQYNLFHSHSHGVAGNHSFYTNSDVDRLIEEARKETDPDKRILLYEEAQQIELDELPLIPLRVSENLAAISKKVDGIWISPSGYIEVNQAKILK